MVVVAAVVVHCSASALDPSFVGDGEDGGFVHFGSLGVERSRYVEVAPVAVVVGFAHSHHYYRTEEERIQRHWLVGDEG